MKNNKELEKLAKKNRRTILDISFLANVGHIGSSLSVSDILTVLYFSTMKIKPKKPKFINRDRLILSKGHAASALYTVLAERGYFSKDFLRTFCQNGSLLAEHPETHTPGVDATTGSLGHGLSLGVGMALGGNSTPLNFRTFVILSDGECDEGSTWEAVLSAGQFKLDNLIAIVDYNKYQAFGRVKEVMDLEPFKDKWQSFGWSVKEIDGHNIHEINKTLSSLPFEKNKPSVIISHSVIGKGVSFLEDKLEAHYKSLSETEYRQAKLELK